MELTVNTLRTKGRGSEHSVYVILVHYGGIVKYIPRKSFYYTRTVKIKDAMFFNKREEAESYIKDNNLKHEYEKVEVRRVTKICEYTLMEE